jgi:caa(3)-type oxidase subunit IV
MAEGKKKGSGARSEPKTEKKAEAEEKAAEKKAEEEVNHPAHPHGAGHKVNLREVFTIFGVLFALTVLEVVVAQLKDIPHSLVVLALVGLAVTKAACVGLYYMHLKDETRVLKLTVAIPMATPAVYAVVLISEAAWRLTR